MRSKKDPGKQVLDVTRPKKRPVASAAAAGSEPASTAAAPQLVIPKRSIIPVTGAEAPSPAGSASVKRAATDVQPRTTQPDDAATAPAGASSPAAPEPQQPAPTIEQHRATSAPDPLLDPGPEELDGPQGAQPAATPPAAPQPTAAEATAQTAPQANAVPTTPADPGKLTAPADPAQPAAPASPVEAIQSAMPESPAEPAAAPPDDAQESAASDGTDTANSKAHPDVRKALSEAKRQQQIEGYIENGEFKVPINAVARKRSLRVSLSLTLLELVLGVILINLMLDAGLIQLLEKIPHTNFFDLQ